MSLRSPKSSRRAEPNNSSSRTRQRRHHNSSRRRDTLNPWNSFPNVAMVAGVFPREQHALDAAWVKGSFMGVSLVH
jgi:hypothetical protein